MRQARYGLKAFLWLTGVLVLGCAVCSSQAPVVPTDHYGPPSCGAAKPAATRPVVPKAEGVAGLPQKHRSSESEGVAIEEAGATDPTVLLAREPFENFDLMRLRVADYADCVGGGGCYWADVDAQYKRAEAALDRGVASRKPGEKLAVVLDIDETSLSSYCELQAEDYGFIPSLNDRWIVSPAAAVAIPGALRLFHRARAAGVEVFFITGRPENQRPGTMANLVAAGFKGWKGLDLRLPEEAGLTRAEYKSGRRKHIVAQGYRLILNVGDQWSDLNGEPKSEVSVKIPNPFYFLP